MMQASENINGNVLCLLNPAGAAGGTFYRGTCRRLLNIPNAAVVHKHTPPEAQLIQHDGLFFRGGFGLQVIYGFLEFIELEVVSGFLYGIKHIKG